MSRARDLSRLTNPVNFTVDTTNNRIGLNSTSPTAKLNVAGIVSATEFYGDGSNLEGVASAGLGTALGETAPLDVIYYTDNVLNVNDTTTITVPTGSDTAYTQYAEVVVANTKDLIVADGDDFIPDILGLSTEGITPLSGTGGRIRADFFTNKAGTGAPTFQTGVVVTGVATATTFSGALSGNATSATTATNAQGLTGTPNIVVGSVQGTTGTFSGNVSVGGTLTYEDVTNVDSVGIVTTRGGLTTQKMLKEEFNNTAGKLSANLNIDLSNWMVHLFTTQEDATSVPNIRYSSSESLNSRMAVGETVSVTIITTAAAGGYSTGITIDGNANGQNSYTLSTNWTGGTAPAAGGASGVDIYAYGIMKTADKTFTIIASQTKTSA